MKENLIPTKDLKTGAKVTGILGRSLYESAKPTLKYIAQRQAEKILKLFYKK